MENEALIILTIFPHTVLTYLFPKINKKWHLSYLLYKL